MMSNAKRILRELDRHLDHIVTLVLYGRSAIALGFANAPQATKRSLDLVEYRDAFQLAKPLVIKMAKKFSS